MISVTTTQEIHAGDQNVIRIEPRANVKYFDGA